MIWSMLGLVFIACGPDPAMLQEKAELEAEIAEHAQARDELERALRGRDKQIAQLEVELTELGRLRVLDKLGIEADGTIFARLSTTKGTIRCELWPLVAPQTVLNFVQLAEGSRSWTDPDTEQPVRRPLYDGTIFHRVIPDFMIQGGDPEGDGTGGPGYSFEDETDPEVRFDKPGLLAMANRGPDSNGSQFFITTGTPEGLSGKHTIFGHCPDDMSVVQAIADVPRDASDRPEREVYLRRVRIERQP